MSRGWVRIGAQLTVLTLVMAGCGNDSRETELAQWCALAGDLSEQEDFPSSEQAERYAELAPDEVAEAVDVVTPAFVEHEGDPVAVLVAIADDEVEAAFDELATVEEAECSIDRAENDPLPEGATAQVEAGAARVDVSASEYTFTFAGPVAGGRTSFVLGNDGAQAHFLLVLKLTEGTALEDAVQAEDPEGLVEGEWFTDLAAPGDDEEVVTFDLVPGDYGMVCFLPGPDGTPHAFTGMAVPFTVS